MAAAEFPVDGVAWICVPNETHDFHEHAAVSSQLWIACLQQGEGGTADMRILGAKQAIDMGFRECAVFDHDVTRNRQRAATRAVSPGENPGLQRAGGPADREATRQPAAGPWVHSIRPTLVRVR